MFNNNAIHTDFNRLVEEEKLKSERQKLAALQAKYPTLPDQSNTSLREDLEINWDLIKLKNLSQKFGVPQPWETNAQPTVNGTMGQDTVSISKPQEYGDATAARLDEYMKGYEFPTGKTVTGLVAPVNDMFRNYNTMKQMKLKEADSFFHCKGNYEATSRGLHGLVAANALDTGKELYDIVYNKYPIADSLRDYRANLRGQWGALTGKSLQETCPTHHKYYK